MDAIRSQLLELLPTRHERFVDLTMALVQSGPPTNRPAYERAEIDQMVHGFVAVLREALEGRTNETRLFYLETLIPSLLGDGIGIESLVGSVVSFGLSSAMDLVEHLPPASRAEATAWLSTFWGNYVGEMTRAGASPRP